MSGSALDDTLSFVAGTNNGALSSQESDVYSWLLMNSELFPAPPAGVATSEAVSASPSPPSTSPREAEVAGGITSTMATLDGDGGDYEGDSGGGGGGVGGMVGYGDDGGDGGDGGEGGEGGYGGSKALTDEQKRSRRLEKNREIARNCRKRKRERLQLLEQEVRFASWATESVWQGLVTEGSCPCSERHGFGTRV